MAAIKEAIETHLRTYRSALRSSNEIAVSTLVPTYLKMEPLLHSKAGKNEIDEQALTYVLNRFPEEILQTEIIVIGQTEKTFLEKGYQIKNWQEVKSSHRRRKNFYDPKTKTLACFAASISDVDDIVNLAIALQIELTKIGKQGNLQFKETKIPKTIPNFKIKLLAGTWVDFTKTVQSWWETVIKKTKEKYDIINHPLVFVSSNRHSLINLIDGFCLDHKKEILKFLKEDNKSKFAVYYASQFAFAEDKNLWRKKLAREKKLGILRIPPQTDLSLETQIIPGKLLDKKLTDLIILNIEYPLGFSAFHILEEILEETKHVKGVYVIGKAAALNTKVGDILIPKVVFDEHTQNTYMIDNCFNENFPYPFENGSILDNQRLVSVMGTFLENRDLFDVYSQKEFNIIEMEAGPYLGAITQAAYPKSLPQQTVVDLHQPPFNLGLAYYSSDNPYILSQTLGEFLGIAGIEATYLVTKAVIECIKSLPID